MGGCVRALTRDVINQNISYECMLTIDCIIMLYDKQKQNLVLARKNEGPVIIFFYISNNLNFNIVYDTVMI